MVHLSTQVATARQNICNYSTLCVYFSSFIVFSPEYDYWMLPINGQMLDCFTSRQLIYENNLFQPLIWYSSDQACILIKNFKYFGVIVKYLWNYKNWLPGKHSPASLTLIWKHYLNLFISLLFVKVFKPTEIPLQYRARGQFHHLPIIIRTIYNWLAWFHQCVLGFLLLIYHVTVEYLVCFHILLHKTFIIQI